MDKRVLPFLLPAHFANEDKRTPDDITRRLQHLTLGRVQSTQPRINWSFPATLSLDKVGCSEMPIYSINLTLEKT